MTGLATALSLPLFLVATLFSGAIYMSYIDNTLIRHEMWSLIGIRNLIFAPLTEEYCFRSGLISYLLIKGVSPTKALWISPLPFALAHVHHVIDLVVHQGVKLPHAIVICLVQVGYTCVFGWFAAFLLLRTGHFASLVITHAFCNYMGFPRFGAIPNHPKSVVLTIIFLAGIASFIGLLFPLTEPRLYGFDPGSSYLDLFAF